PDAARSKPMHVRSAGGVRTPRSIRRRVTPNTGFPLVIMFVVARGTKGATRAKKLGAAIHTLTHRSALLSSRVHLSHAGCARAGRGQAGAHQQLYLAISGAQITCALRHRFIGLAPRQLGWPTP